MAMSNSGSSRKHYSQPRLVTYGMVRNLTGGSLSNGQDAPFSAGKNGNNGVGGGNGNGGAGGNGNGFGRSDRRFKQDIQRVGSHPAGFGLYLFRYRAEFGGAADSPRCFGVMGDEVEPLFPDAVWRDANGYAHVDYARIGIILH